jgi:NADPH:quinone reductase-like Zn-dependent oxidoreductase
VTGGKARQPLPAILGIDLAGTVEAVGDGVAEFRPGNEVYASPSAACKARWRNTRRSMPTCWRQNRPTSRCAKQQRCR